MMIDHSYEDAGYKGYPEFQPYCMGVETFAEHEAIREGARQVLRSGIAGVPFTEARKLARAILRITAPKEVRDPDYSKDVDSE